MRSTQCQRWGLWWEVLCTGQCVEMLTSSSAIHLAFFLFSMVCLWPHCLWLYSGICREGDHLVVGPTDSGQFHKLTIGSIQRNRSACRVLRAGQAATLALGDFDRSLLRKVRYFQLRQILLFLYTAYLYLEGLCLPHIFRKINVWTSSMWKTEIQRWSKDNTRKKTIQYFHHVWLAIFRKQQQI